MKKNYLWIFLAGIVLCALNFQSFGQISQGGTPPSFEAENASIANKSFDTREYAKPDVAQLIAQDEINDSKGDAYRFAVQLESNLTPDNSGSWTTLDDGSKIWRLKLKSKNALGLGLQFNRFYIPPGAKLFVYSEDKAQVIGAFTNLNNPKGEEWATEYIRGEAIVLEYYSPPKSMGDPVIDIEGVSYVYRKVPFVEEPVIKIGESESCEVNVNCSPEGDNWQDEKKGVALISISIGGTGYLCTGSLVNNTGLDCTPYFLSAYHCGENATAADYNQWVFYFGYEAAGCDNSTFTGAGVHTTTGATKRAQGINSAGSKSDMLLLELNSLTSTTAQSWGVYFNGWSRSPSGSANGVGIHHPAGDIKKISTYTSTLSNYGGTHWQVQWVATTNGTGVTEGGSSGSPIFNPQGLVVGTLTGGSSYCTNLNGTDIYGKFSFHWQSNGSTDADQLRPWLDPIGSDPTTLDGTFAPCGTVSLTANFSATPTTVVVGSTVAFTDLSTGGTPTSWTWTFPGGTPGSATTANPSVTYNTIGTYDVTLLVGDGSTTDSNTKSAYIHVVDTGSTMCDTLSHLVGNLSLYTTAEGYLVGTNEYGDLAKAEHFTNYGANTTIDGAMFYFGAAYASATPGDITFAVWDDNGGSPNTQIATATVPIGTIVTDVAGQLPTWVDFVPDVTIPGPFFVGFEIPTPGDSVGLYTGAQDAGTNDGFEQWSDGVWYDYTAAGWGGSFNNAIFPVVCGPAGSTPPVADFSADATTVAVGQTVNFTDLSTNTPTSWSWTFAGGSPASSTTQNPAVAYNTAGVYTVSLTATNADGSDTETKTDYIIVDDPATCDTLHHIVGNLALYTTAEGYLAGTNEYGDLAKAEYFGTYGANTIIDGALFYFGAAYASATPGDITFAVWNDNAGSPNTQIATATVPIGTIVTDVAGQLPTWVDFVPDVTIPGPFYVGVEIPTPGDSIGLYTGAQSAGTNDGFEQWSDGVWYDYTSAGWGGSFNNAIFVVACPNATGVDNTVMESSINVFPNPSKNEVFVSLADFIIKDVTISVYNLVGTRIANMETFAVADNLVRLNFNDQANGMYIIRIESKSGTLVRKVSITK